MRIAQEIVAHGALGGRLVATTSGTFRHSFDTNSTLTRHYLVVKKLPVVSMSRCRQSLRPGWHWHQSPGWRHRWSARTGAWNVTNVVGRTVIVAVGLASVTGQLGGFAGVGGLLRRRPRRRPRLRRSCARHVWNLVVLTAIVAGDRVSVETIGAGVGEAAALIAFTERYASARTARLGKLGILTWTLGHSFWEDRTSRETCLPSYISRIFL